MKLFLTRPGWLFDALANDEHKPGWRRIVEVFIYGSALAIVVDVLMI